jgi:hypothetical protein
VPLFSLAKGMDADLRRHDALITEETVSSELRAWMPTCVGMTD